MLVVETTDDGGNPRDPAAIQRLGDGHYRVVPFSEDGDGNYKFALYVRVRNDGRADAPLTLEVDWGEQRYMVSRNFVHVRRGDNWEYQTVEADGSVARLRCMLPPGESAVGLSPAYGLADHTAFLAQLAPLPFQCQEVGRSTQGRAIETFAAGSGADRLLVMLRVHPYETAASFCAEGLLRWLAEASAEQERLLRRYSVVVLPMPNPDGVAMGLCKRTGLGGADLSHEAAQSDDASARVLMQLIDDLRPSAFLDIHGWMHFDEDGLHHFDDDLATRFQEATAAEPALAGNRWKAYLERPSAGSPRWHAAERFGSVPLSVSYRWPGRTVDQMRAIGAATLRAFAAALG